MTFSDDVADLLKVEDHPNPDAKCFIIRLQQGQSQTELAKRLAIFIAATLTGPSEVAFDEWLSRFEGGPPLSAEAKEEVQAYLMADLRRGGPSDRQQTRLIGAIVEHLWSAMAPSLDGDWGLPLHIERDHFSVLDHGGDGLSVYDQPSPELGFRLWESKRHTGRRHLGSVVTQAGGQLRSEGGEYLARLSKPLQTHSDERVRLLAGRMVRLWTVKDARSAVGVSVGKSTDPPLPARPLRGLLRKLELPSRESYEGAILELVDLPSFSEEVRSYLLSGMS